MTDLLFSTPDSRVGEEGKRVGGKWEIGGRIRIYIYYRIILLLNRILLVHWHKKLLY